MTLDVTFLSDWAHLKSKDGKAFVLTMPLLAKVEGGIVTVPAGFETDLDSVPRLPLAYWLAKGRAFKAAILHDYLYYAGYPRDFADDVMYGGMVTEGVPKITRGLIHAGVRAGGWKAYNNYRDTESKE